MIIKISDSFQSTFSKDFKNHNISILDLVESLKKTTYIWLESPIAKVKIYIKWIAIRWLVVIKHKSNGQTIVPLFFVLKSDKKYWDNLILSKGIKQIISRRFDLYQQDFLDWKFMEY